MRRVARGARRVGLIALAWAAILAAAPLLFLAFWIDEKLAEPIAR